MSPTCGTKDRPKKYLVAFSPEYTYNGDNSVIHFLSFENENRLTNAQIVHSALLVFVNLCVAAVLLKNVN